MDVIKLDFGQNGPAPLQTGYVGFNPWGSTSADNDSLAEQDYTNQFANNNSLKISVTGQTHWRDYLSVLSSPHDQLSRLLSDEVLSNGWRTIIIGLDGLLAGQYTISTYHHATEGYGNGTFNVSVKDVNEPRVVASGISVSQGRYPSSINKQTFEFLSNGSNEVQIILGPGGGNGDHMVINGFDLSNNNFKVIEIRNVNLQIAATRNPTSWTASGLLLG